MTNGEKGEFRGAPRQEQAPSPETNKERVPESSQAAPIERAPAAPASGPAAPAAPVAPVAPVAPQKDAVHMRIERKLEENLWDAYRALDAATRTKFKQRGEEVSTAFRSALGTKKMTSSFVLKTLLGWLTLIPHVSKFFLEQEAKIKTDHMMAIDKEYREQNVL